MRWDVKLARFDFLEEHGHISVIKRQSATEQGIQDYPTRPDINLRTYTRERECVCVRERDGRITMYDIEVKFYI